MEIKSFAIGNKELSEKAFAIREEVFIKEQEVERYEEFDEFETSCMHYLAFIDDKAVGTCRWRFTEKGIKLERFAVLKEYRQSGAGKALMEAVLKDLPDQLTVYLHAQVQVVGFYEQFGFETYGDLFSECEIDHYAMKLSEERSSGLTLQESIGFVEDFHRAFDLHYTDKPQAKVEEKLFLLRYKLMREENEEYLEAAQEGDLVEIADALGDLLYILCGTIITHGLQHRIEEVYREIQRSNMSKLDKDGNPIYREDGKVMKSDLYFKPNIKAILEKD